MLYVTQGNAISVAQQYRTNFAHGCNCFCKMGLGIAQQVKRRLPALYEADQQSKRGDKNKLGSFTLHEFEWGIGYNLYTQFTYSHYDVSAQLGRIYEAVDAALVHCLEANGQPLTIPMIGAGAAKGSPREIIKIFQELAVGPYDLLLVEYDKTISKAAEPTPYQNHWTP